MTETLRIQLLGGFHLVYGDIQVTTMTSPRQQSLLAYLLLHRDIPQSRRRIASILWPDSSEKQALTNLRRELHHLRRAFPDADHYLDIKQQTVAWRQESSYRVDLAEFGNEIARAEQEREIGRLAFVRGALRMRSLSIKVH